MAEQTLVIVESPAKAKTINKYLGPDYTVLASMGHVRDLPAKDGSVQPDDGFAMRWELGERSKKPLDAIRKAAKGASRIVLATDPDREGEAISWHVQDILDQEKLTDGKAVDRVTFTAITKDAVRKAFEAPRKLDEALVQAYLARRALDYLVGFTLSPVLWRKLPGSRSAGRVQSVALRLICEREAEIEVFKPQEYWSVEALLSAPDGTQFPARLVRFDGEKLDRLSIGDEASAKAAEAQIKSARLAVSVVEKRQVRRNPSPPFITSTLQMEASRKLGFGATKTMRVAQQLYEGVSIGGETVGLITYMRTDGVTLSPEAIADCRRVIAAEYGDRYLPEKPRLYKSKQKNAQEAHEAIRPTDLGRLPSQVASYLDADQRRLYEMIWQRTIAAEMESAVLDQVAVDIADDSGKLVLRANGSVVRFDGYLKVYREGRDEDAAENDNDRILPPMAEGDATPLNSVTTEQHFTQPPPRYSEASLVKKLEELGIGRPSTYASIMQVLQDRNYVIMDKRRFRPEDRGRLVTAFLTNFFARYVEYDFTARLEGELDEISAGAKIWREVLEAFWRDFKAAVDDTKDLTIGQVIDALDQDLGAHFFPSDGQSDESAVRACPSCDDGRLGLRLGKHGAFIGCSNYPDCKYSRPLVVAGAGEEAASQGTEDRLLGQHPDTGEVIALKNGPYGPYIQQGEKSEDKKAPKPKRVSLLKDTDPATVDLVLALKLLALPREVGPHPESGEMITAGIGRYGPYLKHNGVFVTLPKDESVLEVGLNRAVDLIATKANKSGPLRTLGEHPKDGQPVTLNKGRFGPYVKHGMLMASLKKGMEAETVTLEDGLALLEAKAAGGKAGAKGAKKPAKKASAKTAPDKTSKAKKASGKSAKAAKPSAADAS